MLSRRKDPEKAITAAKPSLKPRKIRIHSINSASEASPASGGIIRIAFEFLDPPGPYSLQFLETGRKRQSAVSKLAPGTEADYYESRDQAKLRWIETKDGDTIPAG